MDRGANLAGNASVLYQKTAIGKKGGESRTNASRISFNCVFAAKLQFENMVRLYADFKKRWEKSSVMINDA